VAAGKRFAVFDLDGTLTRRDTFGDWTLGLLRRQPGRWWRLPLLLGPILLFALRVYGRGQLKGAVMHVLFGGLPRATLDVWSRQFARDCVAHGTFREGLAALRAHQVAGEEVVLLSASPDVYVPRIGELLGVNRTICTEVRWQAGRLDGRLAGPNRRGPEKARVLGELRAARPGLSVIAYGNSKPDLDHMLLCEEAVYVNANPRLARALNQPGLRHVQWG
jgi:phosphatidylglycerophosphatase C